MSSEGVRVSFGLADLMQLNLIHRRLTKLADAGEFVHPEDIKSIVDLFQAIFGEDAYTYRDMINDLRRKGHAPRST